MSYKENGPTLRLDNIIKNKDGSLTFMTSKSNYFNHLLTNRAVDYRVNGTMSLREIYEPGPLISPLSQSKFSNHIGINVIILFNDFYSPMPLRRSDATYSKNKVTSSIASRLIIDDLDSSVLNLDYIYRFIYTSAREKLDIPESVLSENSNLIDFIGAAQNIYEGGKPQLYFFLYLSGLSSKDYLISRKKTDHKDKPRNGIDLDKKVFLVNFKTLRTKANYHIGVDTLCRIKKHRALVPEKSFFANLHYFLETDFYKEHFKTNQ